MAKKSNSIKNHRFGLYVNEEPGTIHICLETWMEEKDGTVLISPDCINSNELEAYVDMLIKELQNLKGKGKSYFTKWSKDRKHSFPAP